ncbi:unnamed protein product [Lepidochelys olivacea]
MPGGSGAARRRRRGRSRNGAPRAAAGVSVPGGAGGRRKCKKHERARGEARRRRGRRGAAERRGRAERGRDGQLAGLRAAGEWAGSARRAASRASALPDSPPFPFFPPGGASPAHHVAALPSPPNSRRGEWPRRDCDASSGRQRPRARPGRVLLESERRQERREPGPAEQQQHCGRQSPADFTAVLTHPKCA